MDQRDAMNRQGASPYYLHQETTESVMGLQSSPRMNPFSNQHFQSNLDGALMGSTLPLHASSMMSPQAISVGPPPAMLQGEPVRRKRGRPRKYGRGTSAAAVSLALSPSTSSHVPILRPSQKRRGRPPGTGRKQQLVSLGGGSVPNGPGKMVPHIINVATGEDVKRKILTFSQGRPATVVLSAIGAISAVNMRVSFSSGTITHEGRFDILSLSGSFSNEDFNASNGPVGRLNLTLAGPDGLAIGGVVEGAMIAASPVQVIVASLLPRVSKTKINDGKDEENSADRAFGNLVSSANV
ncbi:hypothetical protein ABFS82_14G141400 [Erythranthe guttata]|uniref:AT-hook motif nuclear-localized protein n=1 Tax=Erythranthe guttata TaxID=4155 RepID=A0A022R516_ERYGU|nr:hypothetical protein MIMGU_mgv1a011007mg [Erythranthe guttata]